jgi:hypothetical protein
MLKIFIPLTHKGETRVMKMNHDDYCKIDRKIFARNFRGKWYAHFKKDNKTISVHRHIMNAKKGEMIDHKNRDPLDNTRENLRLCTSAQNAQNRAKRCDSKQRYKGAYKKKNRYVAVISIDGKKKHLGSFLTEKEAAEAYNKKAIEIHGEFANLNNTGDDTWQ